MKLIEFIKNELSGWGKFERIIFPLEILLIIGISFIIDDSKVALVSAVCGIMYTIFAGKGKISCYIFGLTGTMCYAFIAFQNQLYGNLFLYMLYYFPMQILGILKWKKHLKKEKQEIIKTKLKPVECWLFLTITFLISLAAALILKKTGGATPFMDAFTTVFSITGLILTIKRVIEQWYIWIIVNGLSVIMWIEAYFNGSNCLATVLMWVTYFVLAFYFLYTWRREILGNDIK